MKHTNLIQALMIVGAAGAWAFAAARTAWFAGDYMIGFSPFVLFGFPFAMLVLTLGMILAAARKSVAIALSSLTGCAVVTIRC